MAAGLGSGRSLPLGGDHAAELRHLWRQFLILAVAGSGHGGSLARGGLGRRKVGAEPCQSRFHRSDRAIDLGEILAGRDEPEPTQAVGHLPPAPRPCGLVADRLEAGGHLADDVSQTLPVLLGTLQTPQRLGATGTKLRDPGGLLEDGAAILAGSHQERIDTPLLDDAVGLGGGACAAEQVADVAQPADLAVDEILALAAAVDTAANLHFIGLDGQQSGAVVEDERSFGAVERLAGDGACEDHVGHLAAAEAAYRLLAEDPLDRVDDVRLARPVRSDDDGDAVGELETRSVGEALEAEQFECLEPCHDEVPTRPSPAATSVPRPEPLLAVSPSTSSGSAAGSSSCCSSSPRSRDAASSWIEVRPSNSFGTASKASRLERHRAALACWRNWTTSG